MTEEDDGGVTPPGIQTFPVRLEARDWEDVVAIIRDDGDSILAAKIHSQLP